MVNSSSVDSPSNNGRSAILAAALDLDGTVIGPEESISPTVRESIVRLAGLIPVFIATGREPADVLRYSKELGLTTPQLCDGGANILDPVRGISTWTAPLGPVNAELVVTRLREMGSAFVATHANGTASTSSPTWNRSPLVATTRPIISCRECPSRIGYSSLPWKKGRSEPHRQARLG